MKILFDAAEFLVLAQAVIFAAWLLCWLFDQVFEYILVSLKVKSLFVDFMWQRVRDRKRSKGSE